MRRILLAFLFLSAFFSASAQTTQTPQPGLYEFGSFDTRGVDTINRGNLNVHMTVPIVNKPGRGGTNFNFALNYDGLVWSPTKSALGINTWEPAPNWGWTTESTAEFGYITYNKTSVQCKYSTNISEIFTIENLEYHDQQGRIHGFPYSYTSSCPPTTDTFPATTGTYNVRDNSGYTIYRNGSAFTVFSRTGEQFDVVAVQTFSGNPPLSGVPTSGSYVDTNGNVITASSTGVFTDTLGTTALTAAGTISTTAASSVTYTYTDTTGTARAVTVNYSIYSVATNFGVSGVAEYADTSVPLISSIVYPDGTQYSFTYEATPGGSGTVTGRVASITQPAGGVISYAYTGGSNGVEADGSPSGITRTTSDGSTSYVRSGVSTTASTTTYTDASSNVSVFNFLESSLGYTYETSRSLYAGAATGTPLQSITTCYVSGCGTESVEAPINYLITITTQNGVTVGSDSKQYSNGLLVSDNNGFITETTAYQTFTGPNSIPFYKVSSVTDTAGSTQIAQTSYSYDQTTPKATSGLPQHVAVTTSRGNLTTISPWLNTTNSVFGATTNAYYDTGSLLTSTNPNGMSTYGYDATGSYTTALTPPTPSSGVSLPSAATYDSNTGLPLTGTDPNNAQVVYKSYDLLLRPTEVDSLDSSGNMVGRTYYSYSANQTGVQTDQSASTYADTETLYDGYGRVSRIAVLNGQSTNQFYQQDNCYDVNGRLQFQSYPYQGAGWSTAKVCSGGGDTYAYDALGRVTTITHADNTTINYSYTGRATQKIDENSVTRITQVDSLGRPTIVCEVTSTALPSSGSPAGCGTDITATGYATNYTYNLPNLTTTITQGVQTRVFQKDSLGRTISVKEPESGTTSYSYAYNSTGLVVTRTRPTANQTSSTVLTTTTTQYDSVGRVLNISYSDGTSPRRFSYDASLGWPTLTQTNLKGRLAGAVGVVNSAGTATAGTIYSYDSLGRTTAMDECLPSGCGNTTYDRVLNYSYDWQGNMLSSTDGAGVTTSYNLYTPAGEVGSITNNMTGHYHPTTLTFESAYGPNGLTTVRFGSGLSQYNQYTSLGKINGSWVCDGYPSQGCDYQGGVSVYGFVTNWRGSNLTTYDDLGGYGNANTYDAFNRLATASFSLGATTFSYSYDRWGNRLAQSAPQGGPDPSYTVNTANNQITTFSYDALGNVLNDGFHSYLYDAENNVIKVDGGSTAVYTYDALNKRVRIDQTSGSQEFLFNVNGQRVSIWNPANETQVQGQFYWGSTPLAFYTTASGQTYFQHQDWLGTERTRTTSDGAVAGTFTSLPFGDNYTVASGTDADAYHFATLDQDSTSSTSHAPFRQYSSTAGRWMSPDSYYGSYDLSNPQSMNRYAYADNSPTSFLDPTGLDPCPPGFHQLVDFGSGLHSHFYGCAPNQDPVFASGGNGGGGGSAGGNGGASSGCPPNCGFTLTVTSNLNAPNNGINKQAYNTCLNNFNQTGVGKVTNFFSLASPLLGPERLHSTIEDVGGSALKYGAYTGLRYLENNSTQVVTALGSGVVADIMHFAVADVVAPVAAVSTALQVGVHAGCAAYSTPSLQPYLPPTF